MARTGKRKTVEVDAATYQSRGPEESNEHKIVGGYACSTFPPLHPNCESETADPDADDLSDYVKHKLRSRRPRLEHPFPRKKQLKLLWLSGGRRQCEPEQTPLGHRFSVRWLLSVSDNETLSTSTYDLRPTTYDLRPTTYFSYDFTLMKSFFEGPTAFISGLTAAPVRNDSRFFSRAGSMENQPIEKLYNFSWQGQ